MACSKTTTKINTNNKTTKKKKKWNNTAAAIAVVAYDVWPGRIEEAKRVWGYRALRQQTYHTPTHTLDSPAVTLIHLSVE